MTYRILLIDDSALSRRIVRDIAEELPDVSVVGEAKNGREGLEMMESLQPDLAILDVEMPIMDGLSVLAERRARHLKTSVLMLSVLTREGAETTFRALELGALDFVPKPSAHMGFVVSELQQLLKQKISDLVHNKKADRFTAPHVPASPAGVRHLKEFDLLLIGSSTGGPQCLHRIFQHLPATFPLPVVVVQHMPPVFTATFAARLSGISGLEVEEAQDGLLLKPGRGVVARGGAHLAIERCATGLQVRLDHSEPLHALRPAVDFSIRSAMHAVGGRILGVIMTGMGRDGVDALKELHEAGGLVLAQDEETSVIFGMNRRAIEEGAVDVVLPDVGIAEYLLAMPA